MQEGWERGRAEVQPEPSSKPSIGSVPARKANPGNLGGKRIKGGSEVEELVDS